MEAWMVKDGDGYLLPYSCSSDSVEGAWYGFYRESRASFQREYNFDEAIIFLKGKGYLVVRVKIEEVGDAEV